MLLSIIATYKGVFAINDYTKTEKPFSFSNIDSFEQHLLYEFQNNNQGQYQIAYPTRISDENHNRANIEFWITVITPIISIIMLLIAILQLYKQRSDSQTNSSSTNSILEKINTLIQKQDNNATKAREDRLDVLKGLKNAVCEVNSQILNNVLTDIAIQKQTISNCCDDLCALFRRTPNILKEGFPDQNPKVSALIERIEHSTAIMKEMLNCYRSFNCENEKSFLRILQIVERLKKEVGIAATKQQRELFINDIISAKTELMLTIDSSISNMRIIIEKYNA